MLDILKRNKTLIILISIMIFSSLWLLTKGMPYAHDLEFHYGRLVGLTKSIKEGNIIALIHDTYYGYGYATGLFYSNFFFYIPAIISLLGISYLNSFKIFYLIINILTTISIYYSLNSITKDKKISIIGTILYMFSSYRLVDIYPRGAMGEILSFMIIPIVILGLYEIVFRDYKKWYIFTIGFVLLLLSHLITTFLVFIFSFIFILFNYKRFISDKNRIKYLIISAVVGLLLGLFFLLPMLEQKLYGNINIFEGESYFLPQDNIVSIKSFLVPTGFFNTNLGIILILLIPIRFFIKKKDINKKNSDLIRFADCFYILGIIAWISTTKVFPWNIVGNKLDFIQFPWRLLIISTPFLVISYIIYFKVLEKKKYIKYITIFSILVSISMALLYSVNYACINKQLLNITENEIGTGEYLLYNTDTDKLNKDGMVTVNNEIIFTYKRSGLSYQINYYNNDYKDTYIELPLFNYYGYKVIGDANIKNSSNNLIRLELTDTTGHISVYYKHTSIQKISYIISSVSGIMLVVYIIIERRRNNGISK